MEECGLRSEKEEGRTEKGGVKRKSEKEGGIWEG
jgi:hypothetical protein